MQSPERTHDLPIGGRFWVEGIGLRGPTGTWYQVRDGQEGARLGLKACMAEEPQLLRRRRALLEREFHVLLELAHPRLRAVYELGSDELGPYFTAEALGDVPAERRPWPEVCAVLADLAASLAPVHAAGLVHCGVAFENLGLGADGRVKLRDFGGFCGHGTRPAVVGRAAFLAPEALQLQGLDARADLFSLGALAYVLLTGRDAYPAAELDALRDVWRSAVTPPSRILGDVPKELDALVLGLLSLDRFRRPGSVAEVLDALRALTELPRFERVEGARTRLPVPRLAGRDPVLTDVRRCVLSLLGGGGGTLAIVGESGSGRTRVLDACVQEGKLLGAMVVRADAHAGPHSDWAVARSICMQLLPELATAFKGFPRHVLGRVIASVQAGESGGSALSALDRDLVLRELRDFLLALTRGQRLVFAIDDVDRIDEPSAALLSLLAQRADEHGLLLAVSARAGFGVGHGAPSGLRLLRAVAVNLELAPLAERDTQALVRSLLGSAPSLEGLGKRLQRVAKGNCAATLELLQSWLERGVVRWERHAWALARDAGKTTERVPAMLRARIENASADARELALGLCVAEGDSLALADYPRLLAGGDFARVARALHELVAKRVLVMEGDGYRFTQDAFAPVLSEMLSAPARRALHEALAEPLVHTGQDAWRRARHLFEAARDTDALQLLLRSGFPPRRPSLELLQRVHAACLQQPAPAAFVHALRTLLFSSARSALDCECLRAVVPLLVRELFTASGASAFAASEEPALQPRRDAALASARAHHQERDEGERGPSPSDALCSLVLLYVDGCALALQLYDAEWLNLLPDLSQAAGLCDELEAVAELIAGTRESLRGRVLSAFAAYERALAKLDERHGSPPAEELRCQLRMHVRRQLGGLQAAIGSKDAEQHAQILESRREFRDAAYRMRARMFVSRGNVAEARKWQQRYELLELQRSSHSPDPATDAGFELVANAFAGDLPGIERALLVVGRLAKEHPGWSSAWCLGECHRRWLQGDVEAAEEALGPALQPALAGQHPHWGHAVAVHVVLLCEQDRARDAVAQGREYERICHRAQVGLSDRWLRQGLAYALGRSGKHASAATLIDGLIEQLEGLGIGGLPLGSAYEIRAKIALYAGDRDAFTQAAQRCADAYFETGNPAMTGKVAQLAEEAAELEKPLPA